MDFGMDCLYTIFRVKLLLLLVEHMEDINVNVLNLLIYFFLNFKLFSSLIVRFRIEMLIEF